MVGLGFSTFVPFSNMREYRNSFGLTDSPSLQFADSPFLFIITYSFTRNLISPILNSSVRQRAKIKRSGFFFFYSASRFFFWNGYIQRERDQELINKRGKLWAIKIARSKTGALHNNNVTKYFMNDWPVSDICHGFRHILLHFLQLSYRKGQYIWCLFIYVVSFLSFFIWNMLTYM